jgi:methionine sulfoxide reductase heme-binding subunit
MTRAQLIRRVVKPAVWVVGLAIPLRLTWGALHDSLGSDPVRTIQEWTGKGALVGLLLTLSVTPLRRLTGWNELVRLRRLLGTFAFFLATLHLLTYVVFDQSLSLARITHDVMEHPWVTAGFSAWLLMVPLALTSTTGMVRRLGGKRWQRLHQLVYLAAAGGVFHFLWLVKKDASTPARFGLVLVLLLAMRLPFRGRAVPGRVRAPEPGQATSRP